MFKKPGQPTKYKKQYCHEIIEYLSVGRTLAQFATKIGVHTDTVQEWKKKHPEFSAALKKANVQSLGYWDEILNKAILGIPTKISLNGVVREFKNYNTTLLIFMMKNRFPDQYREKLAVDTGDLEYTSLSSLKDDDEKES